MKRLTFICLLTCLTTALTATESVPFHVATYNIYKRTLDGDDHAWNIRKPLINSVINDFDFDLFGTQESDRTQVNYMLKAGQYKDSGIGINTGVNNTGWRNAIIYNYERFAIVDSGAFWLSDRRDTVNIGWDGDQNRNCSWAKIYDKSSDNYFYFFSTHFDHLGALARLNSAKLMIDTIPVIAGDYPAIMLGDLNAEENTPPIQLLQKAFIDPYHHSQTAPIGPYGTGHGWRVNVNVRRIDYIFLYNGNGANRFEVQEYQVIDTLYNGEVPSDHFPVRLRVRLVPGQAALRVHSDRDDLSAGTLRKALQDAKAGDSIWIDRSQVHTISLQSTLEINKAITLNGNGANISVASPSISTYRALSIQSPDGAVMPVRLLDMTLKGGNVGSSNGGVALIDKNIALTACGVTFAQGRATYSGGMHCNDTTGTQLHLTRCIFTDNLSTNNAGALYIKAKAQLNEIIFSNNSTARNGSALVSNYRTEIRNSIFTNNVSTTTTNSDYGAAFFNTAGGNALIENCTFDRNIGSIGTGGVASSGNTTTTSIINCSFYHNQGDISSIIYARAGRFDLQHITATQNIQTDANGGAIYLYPSIDAQATLVNSIVTGNSNDLYVGNNAQLYGTHNVVGSHIGHVQLEQNISYNSSNDQLFENGNAILSDHGGFTPTIAIAENGVAYRAGTATYSTLHIPRYDQRNYGRYATPCVGAYEVICPFATHLSVNQLDTHSAQLSWQGSASSYEIEWKSTQSTTWTSKIVDALDTEIDNLNANTTYMWRVRSLCGAGDNGEWLFGPNFNTPFGLMVTSSLDDDGTGTLRTILALAEHGDTIVVADYVGTITLTKEINLTKKVTIIGNGVTIQPLVPSVSAYRLFLVGNNFNTRDTIEFRDMILKGGDISSQSSNNSGGILYLYKNVEFTARNVTFNGGIATYSGALHCNDATGTALTLDSCLFINNKALKNAGALYSKAITHITNCRFENNYTEDNGSAIVSNKIITIRDSHFINNTVAGKSPASTYGGAIFSTGGSGCVCTIENSLFEGNKALYRGSGAIGISTSNTQTKIINSTLYNNSGVNGGAIYGYAGLLELTYCTLTANQCSTAQNGAVQLNNSSNSQLNATNSIFAHNYANGNLCDLGFGSSAVISGRNNVIGHVAGSLSSNFANSISYSEGENVFEHYSSLTPQTPMLANNGGALATVSITKSSCAYGAGTPLANVALPTLDQRGIERNSKPCVGSYEYVDEEEETGMNTPITATILLYPNPAKHTLYISSETEINEINLFSLQGCKLHTYPAGTRSIDVSGLASGSYLLSIRTQNEIQFKKIIISQ